MTRPAKKKPEDLQPGPPRALAMTPEDWEELERGVELFNGGKFWHAHEAWELIWQRHREDERLFLQGLIQLAAAYHLLLTGGRWRGMLGNFEKARPKLEPFRPEYLGVAVSPLLDAVDASLRTLATLEAAQGPATFDRSILPAIQFHKPNNPDLLVEMRDLVRSEGFQEAVRLFNGGYFWDAHERWEGIEREGLEEARQIVQALSQLASACTMLTQRKTASARYLLEKVHRVLHGFEQLACELPMADLAGQIQTTLAEIDRYTAHADGNGKPLRLPGIRIRLLNQVVE